MEDIRIMDMVLIRIMVHGMIPGTDLLIMVLVTGVDIIIIGMVTTMAITTGIMTGLTGIRMILIMEVHLTMVTAGRSEVREILPGATINLPVPETMPVLPQAEQAQLQTITGIQEK